MIKILKYGEVKAEEIFARAESAANVEEIVADIIYNVRKNGDKALFEYCEKFDKVALSSNSSQIVDFPKQNQCIALDQH